MDMTTEPDVFRAVYYPFSRTLDETTLKRAVLLYDEILFVDPMSPRVRAGLYDVEQHLPYLPANVATSLAQEWTAMSDRYDLLQREGLLRLIDPSGLVADPATDRLIARALRADLADPQTAGLFARGYPTTWSMLRTRIPSQAFAHLAHQIPARALGRGNVRRGVSPVAFYMDGHPRAQPAAGVGAVLPDDGRDSQRSFPTSPGHHWRRPRPWPSPWPKTRSR